MKIKLLRNCIVNAESHNAGDIVECSDRDAEKLIGMRKAIPVADADETTADTGEKKTRKQRGKKSNDSSDAEHTDGSGDDYNHDDDVTE